MYFLAGFPVVLVRNLFYCAEGYYVQVHESACEDTNTQHYAEKFESAALFLQLDLSRGPH